jgi:hypothetical protein
LANLSAVGDAKEQLIRRFSLIDGVARLAFKAQIFFSGTIFIPAVPADVETEFRVRLPWKEHKNGDGNGAASGRVPNLFPEQGMCVIRLSAAPGITPLVEK